MPLLTVELRGDIKSILNSPPVVKLAGTEEVDHIATQSAIADSWSDAIAKWLSTTLVPPFVNTFGGSAMAVQPIKTIIKPLILSGLTPAPVPGVNNFLTSMQLALTTVTTNIIIPNSATVGIAANTNVLSFSNVDRLINESIASRTQPDNHSLAAAYALDFSEWTLPPGASFTITTPSGVVVNNWS